MARLADLNLAQTPMRKIILTFGLIAGAMLSAMMLLTVPFQEQIGFDRGALVGYTAMVLAFLMVYFGVRSYRDSEGAGTVSFGRALVVGMGIVGVATVCYVITWEVIYYRLAPDFSDKYAAYAIEKARAAGATEAALAAKAKDLADFKQMYQNPLVNVALTFLEPLPVGLLFALLSAVLLGRRKGSKVLEARRTAA